MFWQVLLIWQLTLIGISSLRDHMTHLCQLHDEICSHDNICKDTIVIWLLHVQHVWMTYIRRNLPPHIHGKHGICHVTSCLMQLIGEHSDPYLCCIFRHKTSAWTMHFDMHHASSRTSLSPPPPPPPPPPHTHTHTHCIRCRLTETSLV